MFNSTIRNIAPKQNVDLVLFSRSSLRWGFIISPSSTGSVFTLSNSKMTGIQQGFVIAANSPYLMLNVRDHGYVVQDEWHVWCAGSGVTFGVIEIMACDCESQALLKDALGHSVGDANWHRGNPGKRRY